MENRASHNQLPLFETLPELKGKIHRLPLGSFPTPVQQLTNLGLKNIWIKRDDLSSPIYGGNKVRKLEFILPDLIQKNKTRLVTIGGIGTNHGLASAVFSQRRGIPCTLLLFEQPVTNAVKQHLLLFHEFGAEMIYTKNIFQTGYHFYLFQRIKRPKAYFLYAGGSSPIGTVGFVNAAFELKKQIDEGLMPKPRYIFCPLGSNGTLAGLALGAQLARLESVVIGVRVAESHLGPLPLATPGTVLTLMRKTYKLLERHSRRGPDITLHAPPVLEGYLGTGYGHPTRKGEKALQLLKDREHIDLDLTYTAKTFAALLDFIKEPSNTDDTILYWHTYNSVDLSVKAQKLDYRALPWAFQRFFQNRKDGH